MADAYDLLVIGAGPGGYVAAIRAAQLGMRVGVIDREHLGGICLNWGCIPTKALLRTSEIYHYLNHPDAYGLTVEGKVGYDTAKIVQRSRGVSKRLNDGVGFLLKKNKVDVIWGEAKLDAPGKVTVSETKRAQAPKGALGPGEYAAKHVIVATGARPRALPGLEPDRKLIWTYYEAMVPERMPKSLLVMGSGAIGIEFASFYRTMGAEVTVVEVLPRILPVEDEEISALARKRFEKQGITILTGAKVAGVEKGADEITVHIDDGKGAKLSKTVERMISAVGVVCNVEGLGLEALGVKVERGIVVTGAFGRTDVPGIYAIGDVAGPPMLAHKAEHEGVACVEAIAGGHPHAMDRERIPGCTYCHPQVASIGMSEGRAKQAGYSVKVGRFPFAGNGKAIALGEPDGLIKTVFDAATGRLLGAHMIGAEVTELIQGYAVAMTLETTEAELMQTVFPHPTLSEMMHESVLDAYGRAIHT